MRSARSNWIIVAVGAVAAGCGFQLRGTEALPEVMAVTYVESTDPHTYFREEFVRTLTRAGAQVTQSSAEATAVVDIIRDDTGRQVLSVSAQNLPEEYLVFYTVRYAVRAGGEQLVEPQTVTLTRGYSYDETEVLGKAREEDVLRQALARDLVSIVMRRIEAL